MDQANQCLLKRSLGLCSGAVMDVLVLMRQSLQLLTKPTVWMLGVTLCTYLEDLQCCFQHMQMYASEEEEDP